MRILQLSLAASLVLSAVSLSACQTDQIAKACADITVGHVAFSTIAASGQVKPKIANGEKVVFDGAQAVCADLTASNPAQ